MAHLTRQRSATPSDVWAVKEFESLNAEEAALLAGRLVVRNTAARELVFVEGHEHKGFFLLRRGRVRIFLTGPDGAERSTRLVHPGETFGVVSVFDHGPSLVSAETLMPSQVVLFPSEAVRDLVSRLPQVAYALLARLAIHVARFDLIVECFHSVGVVERTASYILQLASPDLRQGLVVYRDMTLSDLASFVGATREAVCRAFRALHDSGVIAVQGREITILDPDALRASTSSTDCGAASSCGGLHPAQSQFDRDWLRWAPRLKDCEL